MSEVAAWLAKARSALDDARLLLDAGRLPAALNRTYYAAFYAATAALEAESARVRTHAGTVRRFTERFVRTGRVERAAGDTLAAAFNARQRADYDALSVFDAQAAADLLRDVEAFVSAVASVLLPDADAG